MSYLPINSLAAERIVDGVWRDLCVSSGGQIGFWPKYGTPKRIRNWLPLNVINDLITLPTPTTCCLPPLPAPSHHYLLPPITTSPPTTLPIGSLPVIGIATFVATMIALSHRRASPIGHLIGVPPTGVHLPSHRRAHRHAYHRRISPIGVHPMDGHPI
jgi:hypothetical protein